MSFCKIIDYITAYILVPIFIIGGIFLILII
jgi:hypothetical protein